MVNMDEETAYSTAIRALGEVMSVYDNDKCYPIYGFGAKIPPSHSVRSSEASTERGAVCRVS